MKIISAAGLSALTAMLCGCASASKDAPQDINVVTNPAGASCTLEREGMSIGTVNTPGVLTVQKNNADILITCNKPGYREAYYVSHSGVTNALAASVAPDRVLTAGLSSVAGSAYRADNKYDSVVNITLTQNNGVPEPATIDTVSIPSDRARVTFFRESHFVGVAAPARVRVDGKTVGTVKDGGALQINVAPGNPSIVIDSLLTFGSLTIPLKIEGGHEYYFEITPQVEGFVLGAIPYALSTLKSDVMQSCSVAWCANPIERSQARSKLQALGESLP